MKKFLALLLIISNPLYAIDNKIDAWYGFFNKTKLSNNYFWWAEAQLRYDLDIQRMQQTLIRTGFLVNFQNSEIGLLYAFVQSNEDKEHRIALQHSMNYGIQLNSIFSHRMRLEFRAREDDSNLAERFRYLLRSESNDNNLFKPVVWNEIFINLRNGTNSGSQLIERNRFFLGEKINIYENIKLEIGYMNQYVPRVTKDIMEHVLIMYMFF